MKITLLSHLPYLLEEFWGFSPCQTSRKENILLELCIVEVIGSPHTATRVTTQQHLFIGKPGSFFHIIYLLLILSLLYSRNWQRFTQFWSPLFCSAHDFTAKKQVILEIRRWGICEVSNKKKKLKYEQCCFRFTNRHHNFLVQNYFWVQLYSEFLKIPQNVVSLFLLQNLSHPSLNTYRLYGEH